MSDFAALLFHHREPGVWQPVLDQVIRQLDELLG